MNRLRQTLSMSHVLAMALIIPLSTSVLLRAADVRMDVRSDTDTYVGMPVVVDVSIDNSKDHEPPEIDPIDGLDIRRSAPSTSSQTSITSDRNGTRRVVERSSYIYRFSITPQKAGEFKIPPIKVVADGIATVTKAISIQAKESETGDLLRVEVDAKQKVVYVGEPLEVTLRILVKCFTDEKLGLRLSEESMWSLIRGESEWGFFADRMKELRDNHQRPGGDEVFRKDENGEQTEYYAYEIDATVYPKRAGQIDGGDVNVILHYPEAIGQSEDEFGGLSNDFFRGAFGRSLFRPQLHISKVRPVTAGASVASVQVKPIPEAGRPDDYRGAVGQYKIRSEASPRSCQAGDPIVLRIAIDGTGPMELVRAPDLAALDILTKDFRVEDAPLAGIVDGTRKTFATTIRPRNEFVKSIPAIPYSYFDPSLEKFVTVHSESIAIHVEKADTLALDAIAANSTRNIPPVNVMPEEESTGDPLAFVTLSDIDSLMRTQAPARALTTWLWALLLLPPLFALLTPLLLGRNRIASFAGRLVPAERQFVRRLMGATCRADVSSALQAYLARVTGAEDRLLAIGRLRASGHSNTAIQAERIYVACEKPLYGHEETHEVLTRLKGDAMQITESLKLDASSDRRSVEVLGDRAAKRMISLVGWALLTLCFVKAAGAGEAFQLSDSQVRSLLSEARQAMLAATHDDQEGARNQWATAAEKFQLVIDSGLSNGPLHFVTGQAYANADQRGRAVAAFLRALRIEPTNHQYRKALRAVQSPQLIPSVLESPAQRMIRIASDAKEVVITWIPLRIVLAVFGIAWIALWAVLTLRFAGWLASVWLYALAAGAIALIGGWMYFDTLNASTRGGIAVLLDDAVELREGDGETDPVVATFNDSQGLIVQRMKERGGWVQIQVGQQVGWILDTKLESV